MCFGGRSKDDGGAARSRDLDRLIRQDEKKMSKEVKLLLLGTLSQQQPTLSYLQSTNPFAIPRCRRIWKVDRA